MSTDDTQTSADDVRSTTGDEPLLSLENVSVEFEDETATMEAIPERVKRRFDWQSEPVRAVDDVSLDIKSDEIVAVIGESGSGKTTLGKTAVAIQEPTSGTVRYRGYDVWELREKRQVDDLQFMDIRQALQIIHQDPGAALNPYQTLRTILKKPLKRWYPDLSHADCRERILSVFRVIGLTPAQDYLDRYPHELSGGEQQRVALVRALLVEPELILADEPVSALDPSLRVALMDLMLELKELFGMSFLFVSHNLQHARYLTRNVGGRVAVMYLGEVVEIGPAEEVFENPKHPYTKVLMWASLPSHPDEAREKLEDEAPLRGMEVPDITEPPSGCRFHPRCPKARETCATNVPDIATSDLDADAHEAACLREDDAHEYWNSEFLDERGEIEIPN
jgi:peptide/nickel transport system ATP-binding protein